MKERNHGVPFCLQDRDRASTLLGKDAPIQGTDEHFRPAQVLDATRPEGPGLEAVLTELAQIVARREIGRRAAAVLVRLVDPANWATQRMLVEELVSCLGPSLPAHLADRPLDSLVSAYGELVRLFLQAQGFLGASHYPTETPFSFPPLSE